MIVVWVDMNALGLRELRSTPSLLPTFQTSTHSFPCKQRPWNMPTPQATTVPTMQICFFPFHQQQQQPHDGVQYDLF